VLVFKIGAPDE
jgi:hypothetical protein